MAGFASAMAFFYDALNDAAPYEAERDLVLSLVKEEANLALDLGCGTGELCLLLSEHFDTIGVDASEEMLACADEKAFARARRVRFVRQDITRLNLGLRADVCTCLHDTLNYLLDTRALFCLFESVKRHLSEDGVFLFDFNTKERFENYARGAEILERDGLFCAWERAYNEKSGICDFAFHFFEEMADGRYERSVDYQRQRCYSPRTVERLCREAGLEPTLLKQTDEHYIYKAVHKRGGEHDLCR